jgi:SAM-dependent methyltransferase
VTLGVWFGHILRAVTAVTQCRWCGGPLDGAAERLRGRVRCPRCGVATTDPWPTPAELEAAYGEWYRPAAGRFSGPGDRLLQRARAQFARRIDELAPPGPVLDVGSGDGTLVNALRNRGRTAVGLERGDRELHDITAPQAAVVFWHSLEHLPDAAGALAHASRILAPGGVLVVAVPNNDSLQAKAFGDDWLALDIPRHLFHLTAHALRTRMTELGLTVTRESHLRGGQVAFGWLHGMTGKLPGHPDLYDAIRRPEARQTAIAGGRRAATLGAAAILLPAAVLAAGTEAAARRGGTVLVEAVAAGARREGAAPSMEAIKR